VAAIQSAEDPFAGDGPIVTRSAGAQVADRIVQAIREGRLKPQDKLPSERELGERFGVSRPTVREALAGLELAGVVRSYKGSGTVIVGTAAQLATWGVEVLPTQIFEARIAIEPSLAALAAEKRYPEDIDHLRRVVVDLEAEFAATRAYASDLQIHRAIARAARNPILERALEDALVHMQGPLWERLRQRALVPESAREGHVKEARAVLEHIERGEPEEAAAVWRQHLLAYRDEILHGEENA
jgi:DNA-binding FadR family transcriptional regulator